MNPARLDLFVFGYCAVTLEICYRMTTDNLRTSPFITVYYIYVP